MASPHWFNVPAEPSVRHVSTIKLFTGILVPTSGHVTVAGLIPPIGSKAQSHPIQVTSSMYYGHLLSPCCDLLAYPLGVI